MIFFKSENIILFEWTLGFIINFYIHWKVGKIPANLQLLLFSKKLMII
jgi:hypothetical protein